MFKTTDRDVGTFVKGLFVADFTITFAGPPETCCRITIELFCAPSSCVLPILVIFLEDSDFIVTLRSNRFDVDVVTIRSPEGDSISFWPG